MDSLLAILRRTVEKRLAWDDTEVSASLGKPAVFILTPPRSGSTLLRVMLAGHPELFAPPELELLSFTNLKHRREGLSLRHGYMLRGLVRAVMALRECGEAEAEGLVNEWEARAVLMPEVYAQLQEWCGSRMLVDKSVHYALSPKILQRAADCFGQARFIHLTRHPQATLQSIVSMKLDKELFGGVSAGAEEIAEGIWTLSHENILGFLDPIPAGHRLRVRYEDLVSAPQDELGRICAFLGIAFHPAMLLPYAERRQRMTDEIGPQDPNFHRHQGIDARLAEAWRDSGHVALSSESMCIADKLHRQQSCCGTRICPHPSWPVG
ncbi:MAG: sulfotransferase [Candidatus Electrothrix scaldis]|nr:MAG: sulfotransferase [Candidatus Electrothrix sp. GW3-3]